jgi:hypothetical protein
LYEKLGDRFASTIVFDLFTKWRLPMGWAQTFHEVLTSNSNWERLTRLSELPDATLLKDEKSVEISDLFEVLTQKLFVLLFQRPELVRLCFFFGCIISMLILS